MNEYYLERNKKPIRKCHNLRKILSVNSQTTIPWRKLQYFHKSKQLSIASDFCHSTILFPWQTDSSHGGRNEFSDNDGYYNCQTSKQHGNCAPDITDY